MALKGLLRKDNSDNNCNKKLTFINYNYKQFNYQTGLLFISRKVTLDILQTYKCGHHGFSLGCQIWVTKPAQ